MPQLNTQPKLQTKYKESTTSSIDIASSWVSTHVDYNAQIVPLKNKKGIR